MRGRRLEILLIEPYYGGSHRAWADGYRAHSRHALRLLSLPDRFWKWRMHGASLNAARRLAAESIEKPDLVLASSMLDLASFAGLARERLDGCPLVLYMHENQLAYPVQAPRPEWEPSRRRRAEREDLHYAWINLSSAFAAEAVLWNSAYNRDSFLDALPAFLKRFPDAREPAAELQERIASRSQILPPGLDLEGLGPPDDRRGNPKLEEPLRIVWNHRWEFDKDPWTFFEVVGRLLGAGISLELILLGERFGDQPDAFAALRSRFAEQTRYDGFAVDRVTYGHWLSQGDVVVSTAQHEFFGMAVCEAIHAGCMPLLPDRLSYPELLPESERPHCLYSDPNDLERRLTSLAADRSGLRDCAERCRKRVAAHAWPSLASRYDTALEALADARS